MFQEKFQQLNSVTPPQQNRGCKRGCLMLLLPPLVIYLAYGVYIIPRNLTNQIKWHLRGSQNYKFTVSEYGLLPPDIQIGRNVVVEDGEIIHVSNVSAREPVYTEDINSIDGMFAALYFYPLFFPLFVISVKYDPYYGFPSDITVNCPIPDACYTRILIKNVELFSPE